MATPADTRSEVMRERAALWRMPSGSAATSTSADAHVHGATPPPLVLLNSLTRSKERFVPMNGRQVLWYMCGPTVYDSSHIGHARTYVAFDIVRRVLSRVFGYSVLLTMNITDIDDKIIKRSNEAGIEFTELARKYEAEFLADMEALGVAPPDVMTRVSEYVPEIISFISRIIERGYAYESGGSVYFSVPSFHGACGHVYAKLVPENAGDKELLAEGEGVLTSVGAADKRNDADFALWKASKPGEPSWDSPWGSGRPGWHIECSAMCDATLGGFAHGAIDIHSGGVDLRFPHHDNEIAQSEAFYDHHQWVNYFLHTGHLHIEGLKMSKSLKNFVKIADALERFGARALRLLFLRYRYNAPMNYSEDIMVEVKAVEKLFVTFIGNTKAKLRSLAASGRAKWEARDHAFATTLLHTKDEVFAALADDIDTPTALRKLENLVSETNKYMNEGSAVPQLLRSVLDYVGGMLTVFGVIDPMPSFDASSDAVPREVVLGPVLDAVAAYRDVVRQAAKAGDSKAVLVASDRFRDEALPPLGIVLEDETRKGASATEASAATPGASWKLRDPAELMRELEDKKREVEARAAEKARLREEQARIAAEREARNRVDPRTMFTGQTDKYSQFDADGVPTHDAAGTELGDKAKKKLRKEWDEQLKKFETWRAKQAEPAAATV